MDDLYRMRIHLLRDNSGALGNLKKEGEIPTGFYVKYLYLMRDGNILASGAWSTKEQIQLWDIRSLKFICNIEWDNKTLNEHTYIYSVKFNQRKRTF